MMGGFQGMRGKKASDEYEEPLAPDWQKRAPMGFQGMRGRKRGPAGLLDELDELDKRANLGFHVSYMYSSYDKPLENDVLKITFVVYMLSFYCEDVWARYRKL